jgi:hypothetical protein
MFSPESPDERQIQIPERRQTPLSRDSYFLDRSMTALVIAFTPVRIAGSGCG